MISAVINHPPGIGELRRCNRNIIAFSRSRPRGFIGDGGIRDNRNHLARETVTLGALFVGYCGYYLCRSNLAVCADSIIAENAKFGFDRSAYGALVSMAIFAYAMGKVVDGRIVDQIGGKPSFVLGMVLSAACTVAFGMAGPGLFVATCLANRLVQPIGWPAMMSLTSVWFPFERRATIAAFLSTSFLLGDAAARYGMGELLAAQWHWRSIYFACAAVLTGLAGVALVLVRDPRRMDVVAITDPRQVLETTSGSRAWVGLLTSPEFWIVCVLSCGLTLTRETFNNWSALFLREAVGLSAAAAAKGSSIFPLVGAFAVLGTGWLTRRLGNRHAIVTIVCLVGLVVVLLALARMPLYARPRLAIALLAASSACLLGPYSLCAGVMAIELGGKQAAATAAGWIDAAGYICGAMAGAGVAEVSKRYGWETAFHILAAVAGAMIVAAFAYGVASRRRRIADGFGIEPQTTRT